MKKQSIFLMNRALKTLILGFLMLLGAWRAEAQITVTATVGATGTGYATLALAFSAINAGTHGGDIIIAIGSTTTEAGPCVLNSSGAGSASYTSVNIHPTADGVTIAGPTTAGRGLIELNGADNVTIDGDNPNTPGINQNLTITNTATNTLTVVMVIRLVTSTLITSADNNTIKNCILNGSSPNGNASGNAAAAGAYATSSAVFAGGGGSTASATTAPSAILTVTSAGAALATYNNLTINNNIINNCGRGIQINGASATSINTLTVSNNTIGASTALTGSIPFTTPASTVYVKGMSITGATTVNVTGNTIQDIISYVGGSIRGIEVLTATTAVIQGNTISNVCYNGALNTGLPAAIAPTAVATCTISSNTITNIQTLGVAGVFGIENTTSSSTISNNKITKIYNHNNQTVGAFGIDILSGNNCVIQNNFISDVLIDMTGGASFGISFSAFGIRIVAGTGHKVYYNTINLSGTLFGTANSQLSSAALAIVTAASTGMDIRNNIFSNTITGGTTSVAHAAIYLPSNGTSAMNLTLNNNAYYSGTATATQGIAATFNAGTAPVSLYQATGFNAGLTTSSANLRGFTSALSTDGNNDNASIADFTPPVFVSATDLHLQIVAANVPLVDGAVIASVTTDIDGTTRSSTLPVIGAHEASLLPSIHYTTLPNTCLTTDITFTATITDPATGISTANPPQIFVNKNGTWFPPAAGVFISGSSWRFTISASLIGGLLPLDVITYFVTAQNNSGMVFSNSPGFVGTNSATVTTYPTSPSSFFISALGGTYHVGVGKTFTTISQAVNTYNTSCLTGAVTFLLDDNSYPAESFPITIKNNPNASAVNTLLIKPNTTVTTTTITCASSTAGVFFILGNYATIDGSKTVGGITQDLVLKNTSATSGNYVVAIGSPSAAAGATHNTLKNCIITGGSTTTTLALVSGSGTTVGNAAEAPNNNNTFLHNTVSSALIDILIIGDNDLSWTVDSNIMSAGLAGMEIINIAGSVYSNTITSVTVSNAGAIIGIYVNFACPGLNIYNNDIISIVNTSASASSAAYGIELNNVSGSVNVYNNFVSNVVSRGSATLANNAFGIVIDNGGGSGINIYHNSVSMNSPETGTAGTTAALFISSAISGSALMNIKNNIFSNTQTSGAVIANRYAIYNASSSGGSIFASIDNNDYWTNTGVGAVLGSIVVGGVQTAQASFTNLKNSFGGNGASINQNASLLFTSVTTGDLHITLTGPCPISELESGGVNVGILTDIDGDVRPGPIPVSCGGVNVDIGADEFNGTIQDVVPPSFAYSLLGNTCSTGDVVLNNVTITDATGIPTTGTFVPQIYFKKTGQVSYFHSPGTLISGTATSSVWSFTISATTMGAPVAGNVISYFIAAQDVIVPANVATNPSATVTPADVNSVTTYPSAPNTYVIGATLGNITQHVGVGKDYITITQAVAAYNAACLSGPVTFLLDDPTYPSEPSFPITINNNPFANSTNTLTIKPNTTVTSATITCNSATAGAFFIQGSNVTIDGSNTTGGTSQNLVITNTNTSGNNYVIRIGNPSTLIGATSNTIKNCILTNGSNTGDFSVIVSGSGSSIGSGAQVANSSTTIQNNVMSGAQFGVYYAGNTISSDPNLSVSGNTISNVGAIGVYAVFVQSSSINTNTITNVNGNFNPNIDGIEIAGTATNVNVFNNSISHVNNPSANGAYGVYLSAASGSTVNVYNNFIWDIVSPGSTGTPAVNGVGIYTDAGSGYNIYYNTVNLNTNAGGNGIPAALMVTSGVTATGAINLKDNILANTQAGGSTQRLSIYCGAAAGVFASMDNNDYYTASGPNLGFLGGALAGLPALKSGFGPTNNISSISAAPAFVSTTDMHLTTAPLNSALQAGVTISSPAITKDIDGDTRAALPVIGADEVHIPPAITYTALLATTCGNGDIVLTGVNIQSGRTVPITTALKPQIYFKKNGLPYNHAGGTLISGTSQTGTWTFTISAVAMSGLTDGDIVSYYIIAQDTLAGNIASSPSGVVATSVNSVTTPPAPNTTTISFPVLNGLVTSKSVCFNATAAQTANYAYTGTPSTPFNYKLTWAPTGTLTDVGTLTSLPASPIGVSVPANTTGTYGGALVLQNSSTLCTNTVSLTLIVNPLPVITFTGQAGATTCASVAVTYTTQTGMTGYTWTYPSAILNTDYSIVSGGTVTSPSVTVKWLNPGSRTVAVNYTDANSCTDLTAAVSSATTVLVPPVAIINNAQMCAGGATLTLSDASAGGVWSSTSNSVAPIDVNLGIITPGIQGTATITYSNGCGTAAQVTATVNASPTAGAGITGNVQMCTVGSNIILSDAATNGVWSSVTTTVATIDVNTGVAHPIAQGTTQISYSNGCGSPAIVTATVNATPTASGGITGNSQICIPGPNITLNDPATNGVWSSVTTTVATIDINTGIVHPVGQGTTQISYFNGCGIAAVVTTTVNADPSSGAGITGNSQICILGPNLTLNDAATNGVWTSGTTTTAVIDPTTGIVQPVAQGTTQISYSNGCGTTAAVTATVNATPTDGAGITGNSQICILGPNITLADAATNGVWASATTTTAIVDPITGVVQPVAQGTSVISYSNGCGIAAVVTATVNADPSSGAGITGNTQMCEGGPGITLSDAATNGVWNSSIPGTAVISASGVVTPGGQGTTVISYDNGCGTAAVVTATVNAAPVAIGNNTQICAGGSFITLTDGSTNGTWSGGTSGIATVNSTTGVVTSGNTQGTTTFSYSNGCSIATSVTATVNTSPASIAGNTPVCANGTTFTLTNTSTNGTWSGGTPGIATVNSITGVVRSGTSGGTTIISYTNGCSPAATVTVTIDAMPTIHTFTGGGAYCAGDPGVQIGLTLSDTGISYQLYRGATIIGSPISGTGSAISFGIFDTVGNYHALATNIRSLCTTYLTGVTVSINPLPDTFTVTGGGSYCAAGAGMHIGLDGSATGINYQLYNAGSPVGSPIPGTGSALDFGQQTDSGAYMVIATNAITHCTIPMAGADTIHIIPLPIADTVTGGGGYCATDSGVHVGLNASTAGIIYQLYRGATPVGTPDTSTGGAIDFGLETTRGIYTVIATDPVTTCSSMMTGSVTVTVNPLPRLHTVTGGGSFCLGGLGVHIGLNGSFGGISYQLYTGATAVGSPLPGTGGVLDFGLIAVADTYYVVATNTTSGCTRNMRDSVIVSINPVLIPTVHISTGLGSGDTVCSGAVVTFTAQTTYGGTTPTYIWTVNGTSVTATDSVFNFTPVTGDVISVTLISDAVCAAPDTVSNSMTTTVEIREAPSVFILASPAVSIAIGQPDTFTAITTNCGASPQYQWYKNGVIITGANNMVYTSNTIANHDSISCMVITSGACGGQVTFNSIVMTVFSTGVTHVTQILGDVRLIPNPNNGAFTVKGTLATQNDEEVSIEITDMLGQVVYHNKITARGGIINDQIQLSATLANGMYMLNLLSASDHHVFHFVIEQ